MAYLIYLIPILAIGGAFTYNRIKKTPEKTVDEPKTNNQTNTTKKPVKNEYFPLKKGMYGDLVYQLQRALQLSYGREILPVYGADRSFGTETQNAIKEKYGVSVVSEALYSQITGKTVAKSSSIYDPIRELSAEQLAIAINKELTQFTASNYNHIFVLNEKPTAFLNEVATIYNTKYGKTLLVALKKIWFANDSINQLIAKLENKADGQTPGILERWLGTIETENKVDVNIPFQVFAGVAITVAFIILLIQIVRKNGSTVKA